MAGISACICDVTECPICSCNYSVPKSLPCLHTFCLICLELYCSANDNQSLTCPLCRNPFQLPEGECQKLPTNFFIEKLISAAASNVNILKADRLNCKHCEQSRIEVKASSFCIECEIGLCDRCTDSHRKDKHSNFDAKVIGNGLCEEHNRDYELFCQTCNEASCLYCSVNKHKRHELCEIDGVYEKAKLILSNSIKDFNKKMDKCDVFDNLVESHFKNIEIEIEKRAKEIKEKIDQDMKKLNTSLNKHKYKYTALDRKANLRENKANTIGLLNSQNKIQVIIASEKIINEKSVNDDTELSRKAEEILQINLKLSDIHNKSNILGQIKMVKDEPKEIEDINFKPGVKQKNLKTKSIDKCKSINKIHTKKTDKEMTENEKVAQEENPISMMQVKDILLESTRQPIHMAMNIILLFLILGKAIKNL